MGADTSKPSQPPHPTTNGFLAVARDIRGAAILRAWLLTTNPRLPLLAPRRMNAVRIRKENQVLNAEEKRAMSTYSYEEKVGREAESA